MNFEMFGKMKIADADAFLRDFLAEGAIVANELGITPAVELDFLPSVLEKIAMTLEVTPRKPDPSLPAAIRETQQYQAGLFDFTADSMRSIVGAAYVLGDAFVRTYPSLRWSTGSPEYATANMPVVVGFRGGQELPPLLVARNMFSRFMRRAMGDNGFAHSLAAWRRDAEDSVGG